MFLEHRFACPLRTTREEYRPQTCEVGLSVASLFWFVPRPKASEPLLFLFQLIIYFPHQLKKFVWVFFVRRLLTQLPPMLFIFHQALEKFV